jgi:hypothetical protein
MKLTITDKVFTIVESGGQFVCKGTDDKTLFYFKEETNKYILSKEQLEKVISDAFEAGGIREYQERNYERRDYDAPIKEQYINLIL